MIILNTCTNKVCKLIEGTSYIYIYIYIYNNLKETQTWLNCHYKFILVENIIILSVSSDDYPIFESISKFQRLFSST